MTETTKRQRVLDAIRAQGGPCSIQAMKEWLEDRFPGVPTSDVGNLLSALTVNDRSRRHNGRTEDVLIKARVRGTQHVRYWFYDQATNGPAAHTTGEDLDWTYNWGAR
jgi:Fe2+ or Zn2+ uptake regulation protein